MSNQKCEYGVFKNSININSGPMYKAIRKRTVYKIDEVNFFGGAQNYFANQLFGKLPNMKRHDFIHLPKWENFTKIDFNGFYSECLTLKLETLNLSL